MFCMRGFGPRHQSRRSMQIACSSGGEGGAEPAARQGYRGVTRLERERKWVARVWNGQKQLTLGRFETDVAAAQVGVLHPTLANANFCSLFCRMQPRVTSMHACIQLQKLAAWPLRMLCLEPRRPCRA